MDKLAGPNAPGLAQFGKALQEILDAIHKFLDATGGLSSRQGFDTREQPKQLPLSCTAERADYSPSP